MVQVSKQSFYGSLCSKKTHFRAMRARGEREPKKVHTLIIFTPRQFQRAIARPNPTTWYQDLLNKSAIII